MRLIGFALAYKNGYDPSSSARAHVSLDAYVFTRREDAEAVMAAEKLKGSSLTWSMVEVHASVPGEEVQE